MNWFGVWTWWVTTSITLVLVYWQVRQLWKAIDRVFQQISRLWTQIGHIHDLLGSGYNERTVPDINLPRASRIVMRLDRDRRSDTR